MEDIQGFQFLSGRHKFDRFADDRLDRQGGTAAGVTVHLGQDNPVEVQAVIERLGGLDGILAGHGIHDEKRLRWLDSLMQGRNLVHQFLVYGQTAGGIDHHHRKTFGTGLGDGVTGDDDRILLPFLGIDRNLDALTQDLQLLDSCRTECIAGRQQDLDALLLDIQAQFAGERRLTGTVEAGHENDARVALDVDVTGIAAHEIGQFVMDDLDHHLLRLDRGQHILAQCLGLDAFAEFLRHLETDVRIQQRLADVLDRFGNIDFGDFAFTLQDLERPFQPFTQILKHSPIFGIANLARNH